MTCFDCYKTASLRPTPFLAVLRDTNERPKLGVPTEQWLMRGNFCRCRSRSPEWNSVGATTDMEMLVGDNFRSNGILCIYSWFCTGTLQDSRYFLGWFKVLAGYRPNILQKCVMKCSDSFLGQGRKPMHFLNLWRTFWQNPVHSFAWQRATLYLRCVRALTNLHQTCHGRIGVPMNFKLDWTILTQIRTKTFEQNSGTLVAFTP